MNEGPKSEVILCANAKEMTEQEKKVIDELLENLTKEQSETIDMHLLKYGKAHMIVDVKTGELCIADPKDVKIVYESEESE